MKRLPENVRSLISASNKLNNHTKAVEELVYNSLDAGATSVAIRVNIEQNLIQVIDNGSGVSKKDLKYLGKNYMTSKYTDLLTLNSAPNKYGFRGQSLSNLIHISKSVIVTSRHETSDETWKKIFENGKEKQIESCGMRPSRGTTVEVKGFLYNLNINKKDAWHDLQSIKTFLEHLSLVHSNISLSLRDDLKNEIIFKIHKSRDLYQTLSTLYNIKKEDIQEFNVEKNEYKVKGILGKSDQECGRNDIFLNGKYISDSSKLHKTVNGYIKKHLHLKDRRILKVKNGYEENCNMVHNKITFYFIFVTCPYSNYNLSSSPKQSVLEFKDWNQMNKLLEKLIKFSAGDVNLKEISKDARDKPNCKKSDTRGEVKKIMEKILGTRSKKPTPHIHKGIKGQQVKRKVKPLSLNKVISKEVTHDNTKNKYKEDNSLFLNDIRHKKQKKREKLKKNKPKNQLMSNKPKKLSAKDANKVGKVYNSKFKHLSKNKKHVDEKLEPDNKRLRNKTISMKPKLKENSLIRKFQMNSFSVQKRCNELEQEVKKALNERTNKTTAKVYVSEQFSNMTKTYGNVSVQKKINEMVIKRYLPISKDHKPEVEQKKSYDKVKENRFQSNYDLLETILKTQEENNERKIISRKPLPVSIDCSAQQEAYRDKYKPVELETDTNFIEPFVTFQSHNYFARKKYSTSDQNCQRQMRVRDVLLETEEPCYNEEQMEVPNIELFETSVPDSDTPNLNKKPKKNIKNKSTDLSTVRQCRKNTKCSLNNRYSKQVTTDIKQIFQRTSKPFFVDHFISTTAEKPYTIDFTDSNSNKIINGNSACMNLQESDSNINTVYSVNIEETWTQSANTNKYRDQKNDHVIINSYSLSNSYKHTTENNDNWSKYDTYTIEHDTCENFERDENISWNKKNIDENYIFVSKSQDQEQIKKTMDPMTVCETILLSQEEMEKDLELLPNIKLYLSNYTSNNDKHGDENVEITDISLNCSQKKESSSSEKHLGQFNLPNTEFQTRNFDVRSEDQIIQNKAVYENQNCVVREDENNIRNLIEKNDNNGGFNFKNRPCFLPKGMSPIFENCNTRNVGQCNLSRDYYEDDMYKNFIDNIRNNAEIFEPKIQEATDVTTKAIEKVNAKRNKDSSTLKFNGMCLEDAKVLGQVDDKFIAAIIKGERSKGEVSDFFVLFDQHAVHERIRLENNLSEYLIDNQWVSINIDEVTLKISKDEAIFLHNYKQKFTLLGLQWTVLNYDEVTFSAIPAVILGKNAREADKVIKAVKSLINEEINIIRMQSGCASLYPKSIMDLVFSEACRYAIKFGEKLSESQCVELLKMLSECKTPFQCAHGRPAMAVITEIQYNNKPEYNVNLQSVKEWKAKTVF